MRVVPLPLGERGRGRKLPPLLREKGGGGVVGRIQKEIQKGLKGSWDASPVA